MCSSRFPYNVWLQDFKLQPPKTSSESRPKETFKLGWSGHEIGQAGYDQKTCMDKQKLGLGRIHIHMHATCVYIDIGFLSKRVLYV